jgi:anaerobic magnesium-protoporphyrin IX monomethyl ester cyclase
MSEVVFGQAYSLRLDPKQRAARQPYPPLGTLYAAALSRARGFSTALFDAMLAESEREWTTVLRRERPRVAVLYEDGFNYLTKMCLLRVREASLRMIAAARAEGCHVVVAGSDATDHPDAYLAAQADVVVLGEGESAVVDVLTVLLREPDRSLGDVAGLALRTAEGAFVRTPARTPLRDPDLLPRPAWDLVDVPRYRDLWRSAHGYHSMNVSTTRGCPYHCNWCAKPLFGQRYLVREPSAVADEVAWLKAQYAPDHLWITDDIFGLRPGWVEAYVQELRRRDAVVPFRCLSRPDLLDGATVQALRDAGCRTVWMGAESGSQKVLDAMEKGTRVEQIKDAAARLRAAGIEVGFFLQFGYPGEDWEDIQATLGLVRECRPDDIGVSVSYPLPGTRFHERVRASLGERHHWNDSQDLAMLYRGPFSTRFYRLLHRVVHQEQRLRRLLGDSGGRAEALAASPTWRRAAARMFHGAALPVNRARLRRLAWAESRSRERDLLPLRSEA